MGPLDSLSILLVSMNLIWVFKNTWYILLFSYLENLYHAKERGRYERTPNGVHFAVFPIYMPLVNETLDFKITNIKTWFFTKSGLNFVFLCKNMLKQRYRFIFFPGISLFFHIFQEKSSECVKKLFYFFSAVGKKIKQAFQRVSE